MQEVAQYVGRGEERKGEERGRGKGEERNRSRGKERKGEEGEGGRGKKREEEEASEGEGREDEGDPKLNCALEFKKMREHLQQKEWFQAGFEAANSKWCLKTKLRCARDAACIASGN
jgi:hypothetical protein